MATDGHGSQATALDEPRDGLARDAADTRSFGLRHPLVGREVVLEIIG